ncbi:MAG: lytic transglycosylase domain-containing protein [Nitrospirae bacterium]|nr:lytic transglycosylase domain-containing protein [Nitrospirota bacterium]
MARKSLKKAYNFDIKKRWYFIALMVFLMTVGIRPDENITISAQEQEESDADYFVEEGQNAIFQTPTELKENVEFWKKVYAKYTSDEVVIHDGRYMGIIYTQLDFSYLRDEDLSERAKEKIKEKKSKEVKNYYKNILLKLSRKNLDMESLSDEEKMVYEMYRGIEDKDKFVMDRRGKRVRAQSGQKDFFIKGLIDSGEYLAEMERIFAEYDLPVELTRLTFVESMFNPYAYSKSGAAGVWQFLKATGKRYLIINNIVDERRDPLLATIAAAKFLTKNYESLGSWPLAITAYNHGAGSIRKAVEKTNSSHLPEIINNYNHRRFGFASKNFYAEFLAALDVVNNYKVYFGDIPIKQPAKVDVVQIERNILARDIERYCNATIDEIKRFNPALLRDVIDSKTAIPKGFLLRIPEGRKEVFIRGFEEMKNKYVVRKGLKKEAEGFDKIKGLLNKSQDVSF